MSVSRSVVIHLACRHAQRDAARRPEVRRVFDANFRVYGVRKVWRQMQREGFGIARSTICGSGWADLKKPDAANDGLVPTGDSMDTILVGDPWFAIDLVLISAPHPPALDARQTKIRQPLQNQQKQLVKGRDQTPYRRSWR